MPYMQLTPEELAARKRRNVWIALGLVAFMVLVFTTTVLRLARNLDDRKATLNQAPAGQVIVQPRPAQEPARP